MDWSDLRGPFFWDWLLRDEIRARPRSRITVAHDGVAVAGYVPDEGDGTQVVLNVNGM